MALSTYANLTSNIATWLGRSDLTTYIPDFIRLFEAALARRLKLRTQETTTTVATTDGTGSLPPSFLGVRRVTFNGESGGELEYAHPTWLRAAYPTAATGSPIYYTLEGTNIVIRPVDDTGLTVGYFEKDSAVETTLDSIFSSYPDLYLYGALCEAGGYAEDLEMLALWKSRRDEGFRELEMKDFNEREGLVMRPVGSIC